MALSMHVVSQGHHVIIRLHYNDAETFCDIGLLIIQVISEVLFFWGGKQVYFM